MNSNAVLEQQQISYRVFLTHLQQISQTHKKENKSLSELSKSCESICCHNCTDGYESEICNVRRWLTLLDEIEHSGLLTTRIDVFIDYIILKHTSNLSSVDKAKKGILSKKVFGEYENTKQEILVLLLSSNRKELSHVIDNEFDLNFVYNGDCTYLRKWINIFKKAEDDKIIPGGNLIDFLQFI
jgi:hypothetical protein